MKRSVIPTTLEYIGGITQEAIDARKLHEAFVTSTEFHSWLKQQVKRAKLKETIDYQIDVLYGYQRGKHRKRYLLTLNAAKKILRLKRHKITCVCRSIEGFLLAEVVNHKNSYESPFEWIAEGAYQNAKEKAKRLRAERKAQREAEKEAAETARGISDEADANPSPLANANDNPHITANVGHNDGLTESLPVTDRVISFGFEGNNLRTLTDEQGSIWFCGKDAALMLGYTNPSKAIGDHCKGITKRYPLQTAGGIQEAAFISEGDLYRLIAHSHLPSAQKFERWVFEEVLPSIRKTGGYQTPSRESVSPQDLNLIAIQKLIAETLAAQAKIAALDTRIKTLETRFDNNGYIAPFEQKKLREAVQRRVRAIRESLQERYGKEAVDNRLAYSTVWKKSPSVSVCFITAICVARSLIKR
jgi:prophage antirepressor-like protein/phage anti-repressor protein